MDTVTTYSIYDQPTQQPSNELYFEDDFEHSQRRPQHEQNHQSTTIQAEALTQLDEARSKQVAFAVRSNIDYDANADRKLQEFIQGDLIISFNVGDFLHIKGKYNDDWWIGRVVKDGCDIGFVPSPVKLETIHLQNKAVNEILKFEEEYEHVPGVFELGHKSNRMTNFGGLLGGNSNIGGSSNNKDHGIKFFRKIEQRPPYYVVPAVRPLILIGPSLKGFEITDMMQKVIFDFLKKRFENRIIITRVTADISLAKKVEQLNVSNGKCQGLMERSTNRCLESNLSEVTTEIERVFELARTMQIIALDCDTINHPAQLAKTSLAPILVYLKVASQKVLQRLIKSRGKAQARKLNVQMIAAEKLIQLQNEAFDVILDESEPDEACDHLARYLENYWRALKPSMVVANFKESSLNQSHNPPHSSATHSPYVESYHEQSQNINNSRFHQNLLQAPNLHNQLVDRQQYDHIPTYSDRMQY